MSANYDINVDGAANGPVDEADPAPSRSSVGDIEERNEFLAPPRWRTRTTPAKRTTMATVTFAGYVVLGLVILWAVMAGLRALHAPGWLVALAWVVPTLAVLAWGQRPPRPADPSDDDESWTGYAVRLVLVGAGEPRSRAWRALAALVFGAPVGWVFSVLFVIELTGVF